jgi:hypothetical protein
MSVKMETIVVAHYPQMPSSMKKETILVALYPQMPLSVKMETILVAYYAQKSVWSSRYVEMEVGL